VQFQFQAISLASRLCFRFGRLCCAPVQGVSLCLSHPSCAIDPSVAKRLALSFPNGSGSSLGRIRRNWVAVVTETAARLPAVAHDSDTDASRTVLSLDVVVVSRPVHHRSPQAAQRQNSSAGLNDIPCPAVRRAGIRNDRRLEAEMLLIFQPIRGLHAVASSGTMFWDAGGALHLHPPFAAAAATSIRGAERVAGPSRASSPPGSVPRSFQSAGVSLR